MADNGYNPVMDCYTWRVWKYNRLVGYVTAFSEWQAIFTAGKKFGSDCIMVERLQTAP